jgi:hypothetical protein
MTHERAIKLIQDELFQWDRVQYPTKSDLEAIESLKYSLRTLQSAETMNTEEKTVTDYFNNNSNTE